MAQLSLNKDYRGTGVNTAIFSTVDEDQFAMTIDPRSMDHIIARLTDLYSDPIVATVREIVSNAVDATRLIPEGKRQPIHITLPTSLSSAFKVTDHALGLSLEEIKNIYTRYGMSTKGTDMSQIGAYGLGSKAPLSYTTQFSVTAVKDNVLTEILISIEDGKNTVKIVSHEETDQGNSMTVSIPVKREDINSFREAMTTYIYHPMDDVEFTGLDDLKKEIDKDDIDRYFTTMDYNGVPIELYLSKVSKRQLSSTILSVASNNNFRYELNGVLSGFEYSFGNSRDYYYGSSQLSIVAKLVPGLVDFSSSRDEITNSSRKTAIVDAINDELTRVAKTDLLDKLLELIDDNDDQKRDLLALAVSNSEVLNDDVLSAKLFTLSNGKQLNKFGFRFLGLIDGNRNVPHYSDTDFGHSYSTTGNLKRLSDHVENYFDSDLANTRYEDAWNNRYHNDDEKFVKHSDAQIKKENTLNLMSLCMSSYFPNNIVVVTDINDAKTAKKILRARTTIMGNQNSYLMLSYSTYAETKQQISDFMTDATVKITYYTADEANEKIVAARRETQKKSTPSTNSTYSVMCQQSFNIKDPSMIMSNIFDGRLYYSHRNRVDDAPTNTLGIIIDADRKYSDENTNTIFDEFLPYLLEFKEDRVFHVSIYYAKNLYLRDFDSLIEKNDFVFTAAKPSAFRSVQLGKKLVEQNMKVPDSIDADDVDVSDITRQILSGYSALQYMNKFANEECGEADNGLNLVLHSVNYLAGVIGDDKEEFDTEWMPSSWRLSLALHNNDLSTPIVSENEQFVKFMSVVKKYIASLDFSADNEDTLPDISNWITRQYMKNI